MLSPLLTGAIEPARNTAKACCPSRVHHAFGESWLLWRYCEGAPKAWHPAGIGFLTFINESDNLLLLRHRGRGALGTCRGRGGLCRRHRGAGLLRIVVHLRQQIVGQ